MRDKIFNWVKENSEIIVLGLLLIAVIMLIYIAVKVPGESYVCLKNPMSYYEYLHNTSCVCTNSLYK